MANGTPYSGSAPANRIQRRQPGLLLLFAQDMDKQAEFGFSACAFWRIPPAALRGVVSPVR
jgi:hypothetical protein